MSAEPKDNNQLEASSRAPFMRNISPIGMKASRLGLSTLIAPRLNIPDMQGENPFESLPFPNPGDRIRADDFIKLSQSLLLVRDVFSLSARLFGQTFGQAKLALTTQRYEIQRVITVFGTEIDDLIDESLDNRKVLQVMPIELGERQVAVIVTEAVETRRFTPNLMGLTYKEASERLRNVLGDVTFPSTPVSVSQFVGLTLSDAKANLPR